MVVTRAGIHTADLYSKVRRGCDAFVACSRGLRVFQWWKLTAFRSKGFGNCGRDGGDGRCGWRTAEDHQILIS